MGLTIHYELKHQDAENAVYKLHEYAKQLDLAYLGDVVHLTDKDYAGVNREQDSYLRWLKIQSTDLVKVGPGRWKDVIPLEVFAFPTHPGDGCEAANFGLCRYPGSDEWRWSSFCKTQYASNHEYGGVENFLRYHLMVISILDKAKELGFEVDVSDEGNYWDKRDIKALAKEIGEWDAMMAAFAGFLKGLTPAKIEGSILKYPNFEHLEAKGSLSDDSVFRRQRS